MSYSISEAAAFVGVSTRVLRHYDEIRLLQPSERTDAGYRRYDEDDLCLLQRIVEYRNAGMGLADIRRLLAADDSSALDQLAQQEAMLEASAARINAQLSLVRTTRRARKMGVNLTREEMAEVFGDHDPTQYQEEAESRCGDSDPYKESHRRTAQ
ncbi:MAG: MerR family transcriptional regulator, partial [Candidatus Nanopelagicales bacterium]